MSFCCALWWRFYFCSLLPNNSHGATVGIEGDSLGTMKVWIVHIETPSVDRKCPGYVEAKGGRVRSKQVARNPLRASVQHRALFRPRTERVFFVCVSANLHCETNERILISCSSSSSLSQAGSNWYAKVEFERKIHFYALHLAVVTRKDMFSYVPNLF